MVVDSTELFLDELDEMEENLDRKFASELSRFKIEGRLGSLLVVLIDDDELLLEYMEEPMEDAMERRFGSERRRPCPAFMPSLVITAGKTSGPETAKCPGKTNCLIDSRAGSDRMR